MNRTFVSKKGQLLKSNRIKWRAIDEILLTSLEHVTALVLDGASICLRMAHFLPGIVSKGYKVSDHLHDTIHIQFVLEDIFRFETGKYSLALKAGHGIIIPVGRIHRWSCEPCSKATRATPEASPRRERVLQGERAGILFGASLGVTGQLAADFSDYVKRQSGNSFLSCSHPELSNGLWRMIDLALRPAPFHWRREMIGCELSLWLAWALHTALDLRQLKTAVPYRKKTQTDPSRRLCEETVRFIMSNFNRPIKISAAAGHIGITPRHLNRLFRLFLHDTAHGFLLRTRLNHANKMLQSSPAMKIKEIAFASGFQSPSHFTQCFKRYFGRSPAGRT